jgi:molybdopterin biosynthesis enzyme MoaB
MTNYLFTTPTVQEGPTGEHRLFYFYKRDKGLTVVKTGGTYRTGRDYTQEQLDAFDKYYLGGHEHEVTESEKTALIAGGIGVTEENFTAI